MSYATMLAVAPAGVGAHMVHVEAHVSAGPATITICGLPADALDATCGRIRAAVVTSGYPWPGGRITVNLTPASALHRGSGSDLAIACVVLAAADRLPVTGLHRTAIIGELGLDGRVRPVPAILPMVLTAARAGLRRFIVPVANAAEAALVPWVNVRATDTLHRLVAAIRNHDPLLHLPPSGISQQRVRPICSAADLAQPGMFDSDEELNEFLADFYAHRRGRHG